MKIHRLISVIALVLLSVVFSSPVFSEGKKEEKRYEFEKKDKVKEQERFLEKLREDKTKVDLAIGNTKLLIDKSRNMPYLPELYLRLAELYIEKSRFVYFIRKNETKTTSKALDSLETNTLKNLAIETYLRILNDFPDYSDCDKIRFFLAHEYRELNQIPEMVEQYRALIKTYPKSLYTPECFLLLGDHFINEQDLEMALRHYKKVLDYPDSSACVIARYKLAWGHVNNRDFKAAIKLFEESVKANEPDKEIDVDTYKRVDIKMESLVDMAYCYPEVYKENTPLQAIAYFRNYSWSRQVFTHVLEKLGYRYLIKKKYRHAVEIYRQLATLQHDEEKLLDYARNIFECVQELGDFENADKDVDIIVDALKKQAYSIHIPDEEKEKSYKDYELYARNIVTHLHKQARKSTSIDGFNKAADAYKVYLDFFETSPVYGDMLSNYAETLFACGRYMEAGKQYEKMMAFVAQPTLEKERPEQTVAKADTPPAPPEKAPAETKKPVVQVKKSGLEKSGIPSRMELLNSAVVSYYNALKKKEELNYYEIAYARGGLRTNGNLYVTEYPKSPKVPDILFNIAWITFDEGNYIEAVRTFSEFITLYPQGKASESAIQLTLDAYHLREDFEGLVEFGRKIVQDTRISPKVRNDVAAVMKASENKIVSNLTIDAMNDWELGKQNIEDMVEKHKTTGLGEQALNALIISSKDKGKLDTIFSAGYKLIKYYPESEHVADVMAIMIDSAGSASQYRVVTKYLEEFGRRLPKHEKTPEFMKQAGQIRKALGQEKLSTQDYLVYLARSDKKDPGRVGVMFDIFENSKKTGDTETAVKVLDKGLREMAPGDAIRAQSLIAEFYREKGDYKEALSYRKKAMKEYKGKYGKDNPAMNDAYSAMMFNAVQGSYGQYMNTKLGSVIDNQVVANKAKLLDNLEEGYGSVISLKSPEWVLQACFYAYNVNKEFAVFLKESPMPDGLGEDQQKQYKKIIFDKAQSYMTKAEEYLSTGETQMRKWNIINPQITGLYTHEKTKVGSFGGESSSADIAEQFLKDDDLKNLHYEIFHAPEDNSLLLKLADMYFNRSDYHQAILLAWKVVDSAKDEVMKVQAYKLIGISYLYTADDMKALDAFKEVLKRDPGDMETLINMAGILKHYRQDEEAAKLYQRLPKELKINGSGPAIHPVAKEMYYGAMQKK
ncbi:MAG: tetratricopeptide repeat protein [Proteobacteria bacterium]|nr:tetratricopeptide repeat protein [Pseudomonadota bacterium]